MKYAYVLIILNTIYYNENMVTKYISEHLQSKYVCVVWVTHYVTQIGYMYGFTPQSR